MKMVCCMFLYDLIPGATYYSEAYKLPVVAGGFMSLTAGLQMLIGMCRMYTISTHEHDVLVV